MKTRIIGFIFLLVIVATSGSARTEVKPYQHYFEVDSELSLWCDSLYYASSMHNVTLINRFYPKVNKLGLNGATTNDSMGFYLANGLSEYLTDKLDASLKNLLAAEALAERHGNLRYRGIVGNHTGNVYYLLKDNKTALEYYNRVANNPSAPSSARSSVLNNISVVNMEYYQASTNKAERDSLAQIIDQNYVMALALQQETKDYSNMAGTMSVMVPWFATRGMRDSAYYYLEKCRKLSEKNGYTGRIAFLQIKQAALLIEEGKYSAAADTAAIAAEYYKSQDNPDQHIHALAFQALALDSLKQHKQSSAIYYTMYKLMRESFTKSRADAVSKYETKFKTQEKEISNQKLKAENKAKQLKMNRLILLIVSILGILLASFLFYRNRLKKKELQLKTQEVQFKNTMIKSNLDSEEKERKRIARELHDGVGQQITSIKLGLENIGESQQRTDDSVTELKAMVSEVLDSVRGISHQMMPIALQRFGLVKALEGLVNFLNDRSETVFTLDSFNLENTSLPEQVEVHYYRIAQELTNNILKHANATSADLQLYKQNNKLVMIVADNGVGFNTSGIQSGIGLTNMEARVAAINGDIAIESSNQGTTTLVTVGI